MSYSNAQLQALWIAEGGDAAVAPTMAAIAKAESGGDPSALCYDYPAGNGYKCSRTPRPDAVQVDTGLWQISNGNIGASMDAAPALLSDPRANARAAVRVLGSQGLGAWASYTKGTYLAHAGAGSSGASVLTQIVQSSDNPLVLLQNWLAAPSVNVLYKTFGAIFVLILLGAIPQTSRFAMWVALALLVLLMIQPKAIAGGAAANVVGGRAAPL